MIGKAVDVEMDIVDHFIPLFLHKTDNVVFQFATSECRRYQKPTVVRKGLC